jgi:outer membrane protein assembly factor BamB
MPSRRRFLRACTVAGLAGLAGCTNNGSGDGTTTGTSGGTTGTATTTATPAPGEVAWQQPLPGSISTAPVLILSDRNFHNRRVSRTDLATEFRPERPTGVHVLLSGSMTGDALLVGTNDGTGSGTVSALAPADGRPRWEVEFDDPVQGQPVVVDGTVLAVSGQNGLFDNHTVTALDAASGTEQWRVAPEQWWLTILGTHDGTVFVATTDDNLESSGQTLFALSLADGTEQWTAEIGDNRGGLVTDETVYVPSMGVVDAIGMDGERRWRHEVGDYGFRTLAVAGGTVVFAGGGPGSATIYGLDPTTGEERWTVSDWGAYTTRAAGDRLFVGGDQIARLDPATGDAEWVADQRAALYEAPIADGTMYVADQAGAAAIATDDGTVEWTTSLDAHLPRPAGLTEDTLFVHRSASEEDRNRHVLALDTDSGDRRWEYAGDGELTDPVVGDGRLYTGEFDTLLALAV